jgi:hypothetical protein
VEDCADYAVSMGHLGGLEDGPKLPLGIFRLFRKTVDVSETVRPTAKLTYRFLWASISDSAICDEVLQVWLRR